MRVVRRPARHIMEVLFSARSLPGVEGRVLGSSMNGFDIPDVPLRIREWMALATIAIDCGVFAWLSMRWMRPVISYSHREAPERAGQLDAATPEHEAV
jgi:hypothetical protein